MPILSEMTDHLERFLAEEDKILATCSCGATASIKTYIADSMKRDGRWPWKCEECWESEEFCPECDTVRSFDLMAPCSECGHKWGSR